MAGGRTLGAPQPAEHDQLRQLEDEQRKRKRRTSAPSPTARL